MVTLTVLVPLLAAVLGGLVYLLAANPKAVELGRLCFFAGLLVALFVVGGKAIHVNM